MGCSGLPLARGPVHARAVRSFLILLAACAGHHPVLVDGDMSDAGATDADGGSGVCTTHLTYGDHWIHDAAQHPTMDDLVQGAVTWDGSCVDEGANSSATLSDGSKRSFTGNGACEIALDYDPACGMATTCKTRVTYGDKWQHPGSHPNQYDDASGRVFWDGGCTNNGTRSYSTLSNGWVPYFSATNACELSFRWTNCGGLYANPVLQHGCADPGVVRDGDHYVMVCTSGSASSAFNMFVSNDLVNWTDMGRMLPSGSVPAWATNDFWAPEIHHVGSGWVAYFSAKNTDGKLSIGAASAPTSEGPFTALPQPLVHDPNMGLIDASEYTAPDGTPYLLWKEDGNAVGKHTPIHAQQLAPDGLSLVGSRSTLITNDQAWEGAVTEGPFMVDHGGSYYLFYSGNSYATGRYAIGVARASSPTGPFSKLSGPIVVSGGAWSGPGHCSVVEGQSETYMVYHSWQKGYVNNGSRYPLVDQIQWGSDGWPHLYAAPSSSSRPTPTP
jgi:GH43 family beta-xylosidase